MADDNMSAGMFDRMAKTDFEHARRKSYWRSIFSWLTQKDNQLLPFEEVRKRLPISGQHYVGLRQIAVEDVVGSVGRYNDFDRAFLPRQNTTRDRWVSIDRAHLTDVILPPIEVYKIGQVYFVKDGNHRVSVARERGQYYIDAYVIEIEAPVPIDPKMGVDDLIRMQEYADFVTQTRILDLRPDANIELSLPGQYEKLQDHISVHRWYMGEEEKREIPYPEAVTGWYDDVYLPLVDILRANGIMREFPGRTEGDLYLWIIEHLAYLRDEWHHDVSLEEAVDHFTENYSPNLLTRLFGLIKNVARTVGSGGIG